MIKSKEILGVEADLTMYHKSKEDDALGLLSLYMKLIRYLAFYSKQDVIYKIVNH
jgi:hypothetical protein